MELDELKIKAQEYKIKLEKLKQDRLDADRQLILLEEQYKQYKEKIEESFGSSDPQKLKEIAEQYLINIETLEGQIQ